MVGANYFDAQMSGSNKSMGEIVENLIAPNMGGEATEDIRAAFEQKINGLLGIGDD
jgi:hypothetical protein